MFTMCFLVFIVSLFVTSAISAPSPEGCELPMNELPKGDIQPLYLQKIGENVVYVNVTRKNDEMVIYVAKGEKMYVSCPSSSPNVVEYLCEKGGLLPLTPDPKTVRCTSSPEKSKWDTPFYDGIWQVNIGVSYHGYIIYNNSETLKINVLGIRTAEDDHANFYVSYKLNGLELGTDQLNVDESRWELPDFTADTKKMNDTIIALYGKAATAILKTGARLKKMPLASKDDFIFQSQKSITTVSYVISWSGFLNWLHVENHIRRVASEKGRTFLIYSGLLNGFYRQKEGVEEVTAEIPKYIYKLVVDSKNKKCMVFVLHNAPVQLTKANRCPSRCNLGWLPDSKNHRLGFIECCTVQQIENIRSASDLFPDVDCSLGEISDIW